MRAPVFIGDEVSAAGYRLAGADTPTVAYEQATAALAQARRSAPLVLLTASMAAAVDAVALRQALAATSPLVLVVRDLDGRTAPPDLAARLRAQLGMEP